jgi:hypothetical protein
MVMKKFFLLAALAVNSCGFAQVSIIPKAGINLANAAIDDNNALAGQRSVLGLTTGLGVNIALTSDNFLSVQPEILYSQKGWAAENSAPVRYDGSYRLNYLEIPVLLKISFGGETVRAHVNAGPSFGYLLGGRLSGDWNALALPGGDAGGALKFTENANPLVLNELYANRLELGLNFGGGVGYSLRGKILFFDVRYNTSLTDYNRAFASKNRIFAFTAGLQVPLGE